ncbi:hypothetical protein VNO78_10518 [Psophocarpus tetragonolobus]|uniref:Uncharacterized protein n=1 Tax=Psophocarpus tetragonolobus TaxID=3891 RepID=A0AAN9SMI4_PSOTE
MANTKIIRRETVLSVFIGHSHVLVTIVKDNDNGHHGRPYNSGALIMVDTFEKSGSAIYVRAIHGSTKQNLELSYPYIMSVSHKFFVIRDFVFQNHLCRKVPINGWSLTLFGSSPERMGAYFELMPGVLLSTNSKIDNPNLAIVNLQCFPIVQLIVAVGEVLALHV